MEEQTKPTEAPPFQAGSSVLTRSATDRVLGGVAAGFARRTGLPVWFVRALFIVFTFVGGLGLAVYGAGWFLIRAENEPDTIAERFFDGASGSGTWIGIALIFVAALILLDNVTFLSGGVIWAVGLLVVGVLLYSGDLPRLVKRSESKEGVQQMTTSTIEETFEAAEDVGGGDNSTTPPPPPPTPTPPILPPSTHRPAERSPLGRLTFGVMLIALAGLAVLDNTTSLVSPEPRHYVALGITVLGLGLLVGTVAGRARWLILVGVLALPVLFTSPAFEYNFADWDNGAVYVTPTSFDQLNNSYTQGVGQMVIDLTELDWNGENVTLDASLQIGELRIIVPDDIAVTGSAEGAIGQVQFDHDESSGFNPDLTFGTEGSEGMLDLSAHVGIGHLEIDRVPANG
ncbi:MAG: cell wall-active antibiotics response protein [Acidimicrobiia bacterium]|nr:cell wall-active antibiotics response protein [Acidimicrobiia bacterium]